MNSTVVKDRFTTLRGEKAVLSLFTEADLSLDYVSWLNDPEVTKYSNQRFRTHSLASCANYVASFNGAPHLFLKIQRAADLLHVGTMTAYIAVPHQTVDVGIMVGRRDVWGSGIGQDAWNLLVHWLLTQPTIRKVTAGTLRCNASMVKLLERSGMTLEAVRPQQELLNGNPVDVVYYGKFHVE